MVPMTNAILAQRQAGSW